MAELARLADRGVIDEIRRSGHGGSTLRAPSARGFERIGGLGPAVRLKRGYAVRLRDGEIILTHGPDFASPSSFAAGAGAPLPSTWTRFACRPWNESRRVVMVYVRPSSVPPSETRDALYPFFNQLLGRMNHKIQQWTAQMDGSSSQIRTACYSQTRAVLHEVIYDGPGTFAGITSAVKAWGATANPPYTKWLIFYNGSDPSANPALGYGEIVGDSSPGVGNFNNNKGAFAVVYRSAWETNVTLHELFHTMGAVQNDAPAATGKWHCTDGYDVMCYDDGGTWGPDYHEKCPSSVFQTAIIDCGFDTYFHTAPTAPNWLTNHWNLGASANGFLRYHGEALGSDVPDVSLEAPAVVLQPNGNQNVYFRDHNRALWTYVYLAATNQWNLYGLGGQSAGTPAALLQPNGNQNVYFRGANGSIWTYVYTAASNQWNLYELGGQASGEPVALLQPNGNQNVYFRGEDGSIWTYVYTAATNQWNLYDLGGQAAGSPAALLRPDGGQNVYFRGANAAIWTHVYTPSTNQWNLYDLGGQAFGDPSAVLQPDGSQNVYFARSDGSLWTHVYSASSNQWNLYNLGGSGGGDPAALRHSNGNQSVYMRDPSGGLWDVRYSASTNNWSFALRAWP